MPDEILLLTGDAEAPHLAQVLSEENPVLRIIHVHDRDELYQAAMEPKAGFRRLIAFCTAEIVPADVLNAVDGPAYNFHPGPPAYPGAHAASFAIYDGAKRFGATVHEMTEKVDAGAIVAVECFDVAAEYRFQDLEIRAFQALARLFGGLATALACETAPLPHQDIEWGTKRGTRREFERMQAFDETMSEEEIRRRFRAFG